ncbi:MAG: LCP family protein [Anaerolineae bacterium]|nr:LCP family protein [Anaerolineae bacterium]
MSPPAAHAADSARNAIKGWAEMNKRAWAALPILAAVLLIAACGLLPGGATPTPDRTATPSATPSATSTPSLTPSLTPTPIPPGSLPVWSTYPAPRLTAVTPVPPPFGQLALPEGMRSLLLVGLDRPGPFRGRADAVMLVLYHPRLAKASLISLPPDLFVYLPGYTMQRLSSAYPVGGSAMTLDTLEYNLGIRPDDWLVANLDDFSLLVDNLEGLVVPVLEAQPGQCGDILYPGDVIMTGEQALCFARLRIGADEGARSLRQQELLSLVLTRMTQSGNLLRLPDLYTLFSRRVDSSLTLADLLGNLELALKLGDANRLAYFQFQDQQMSLWQISEQPPATVFLPRREGIQRLLADAIAFANQPRPLTELVVTLQYQLTVSPSPTIPPTLTPSPTITPTPLESPTPTPTITLTTTGGPTVTPTITLTLAP